MSDTPKPNEAADGGLRTTDLFVGMRVRYENMEGEVEANPDYNPYANMEDYASGRLPAKCIYKWVVRCGTDGFYPESVLANGGKLSSTNTEGLATAKPLPAPLCSPRANNQEPIE